MSCRAVIFDYIGTLVSPQNYTMDASKQKLYHALQAEGFNTTQDQFLNVYNAAHEKYRKIRYGEHREVTNAIWVSEALCSLGYRVAADDYRVKAALSVFFKDFIDTLELNEGAKKLVKHTKERCKVGLISNFTCAPVIYASLRQLGIADFFDVVVVSDEIGWRKPHKQIFQAALNKLQVQPQNAIFIGDNPTEDIQGAKEVGLETIFVPSQFNSLEDLTNSKQEPNYIAKDLQSITDHLNKFFVTR